MHFFFFYLFPPVHRWLHVIYYQWLHHSVYSSLFLKNDCRRRMHVVWIFQNRGIDSTDAYINTIINNQEDPHSTHFYLSMFNKCAMVITDDTHSYFSNYFKCVLHVSRWKLSIQFQFVNFLLILGSALIIAWWRHDMSCDDPSSSLYNGIFR